jgi:hypothetical protein
MFGFFSKKKKPVKAAAKKKDAGETPAAKATAPKAKAKAALPAPDAKTDSLKAAIAALEETAPVSAGATLDRAKDALEKRAAMPADRKKLIEQALAIQQTQSKLLDKLPEETRQKLRALAMKTFVIDETTKDKKKLN